MTLGILLETAARGFPDRTAVGDGDSKRTYVELVDEARAWGSWLSALPSPGPVAYLGEISITFVAALFGAALAGRPCVPLNYRAGDAELSRLLRQVAPAAIVASPANLQRVNGAVGRDQAVIVQASFKPGPGPIASSPSPDHPAVYLFTSGTTTEPKIVVITHANLFDYVMDTTEGASAAEHEAALVATPSYHIAAIANILTNVFRCRRLVLMSHFDAGEWLAMAARERVTHAMVVPTMLSRILDAIEIGRNRWPDSITSLAYGGSKPPVGLVERALRTLPRTVGLVNAFGLTESSSTIALLEPEDHRIAFDSKDPSIRARLDSVGRPVPGAEVMVARQDGTAAAPIEHGEIWVRGNHVTPGYLNGSSKRDAEGWWHTGDAGYIDADGFLFVTGRQDDLIIRGGENISPAEVEGALIQHPGVHDAAVVGLPDSEWGQVVAAAVVAEPSVATDQLSDWLRQRLPSYKVPVMVIRAKTLPRNELGKLIRREVALMFRTSDGQRSVLPDPDAEPSAR